MLPFVADGDLYTGTVADFSGMDPIIYRESLQTEQYDSMSLNGQYTDQHDHELYKVTLNSLSSVPPSPVVVDLSPSFFGRPGPLSRNGLYSNACFNILFILYVL
jgi:hypothetical protein